MIFPSLVLILAGLAGPARLEARGFSFISFVPQTGAFSCRVPAEWASFEEPEPWGEAVHLIGPDDPSVKYRTGIDIHRMQAGKPGFMSLARLLKNIRRTDAKTKRAVSSVQRLRAAAGLARFVEVRENRFLPAETAPSGEETLHHYIGFIESGDGYFIVKLSSTEEAYLDYREAFLELVKSFRPTP